MGGVKTASVFLTLTGLTVLVLWAYFGYKKGTYKSLVSLGSVIIAALAANFAAIFLSYIPAAFLVRLTSLFRDTLPDEMANVSPNLIKLFEECIRVSCAVVLFLLLFPLFFAILMLASRRINKILEWKRRPKGDRVWGMAVSLAAAVLFIAFSNAPLAGLIGVADDVTAGMSSGENVYVITLPEKAGKLRKNYIEPLTSNPFIKISRTVGDIIFDSLTTVRVDGTANPLPDEIDTISELYAELGPLFAEKSVGSFGAAQATALERAADTVGRAEIFGGIAGELLTYAATDLGSRYKAGLKISESARSDRLAGQMFDILAETDCKTLKNDLKETAGLFGVFAEHSAFELFSEGANVAEVVCREGLISEIIVRVYSYPRFRAITAGLINTALECAAESLGETEALAEELIIDGSALPELTEAEAEEEAEKIERASVLIIRFANSAAHKTDILEADFASLGRALDIASQSRIMGGKVDALIETFLKSDGINSMGIFSDDAVRRILDCDGCYEAAFESVLKAVSLARAISDDSAPASDAILWLAEEPNSEFAETAASIISGKLLAGYGIGDINAGELADMLNSYIRNLASSAALTADEAETEAICVRYIYAIAKTAVFGGEKSLFGGDIPSGEELVEAFMGSGVISKTVEDLVRGGADDPLNAGAYIQDGDKASLTEALDIYIGENGSSVNLEALNEKAAALASLFGLGYSK